MKFISTSLCSVAVFCHAASAFAPLRTPIGPTLRPSPSVLKSAQGEFAASTVNENKYLNEIEPPKSVDKSWFEFYGLAADFSKVGLVSEDKFAELIAKSKEYIAMREDTLPEISADYTLEQIEKENKEWFPTHCASYYQSQGDLIAAEYYTDLVYHMSDGPILGNTAASAREAEWPLGLPNDMVWALVQFYGEFVYFEWFALDKVTGEPLAKGSCTKARRGHKGGIYYKSEQLTFYRGVKKSE